MSLFTSMSWAFVGYPCLVSQCSFQILSSSDFVHPEYPGQLTPHRTVTQSYHRRHLEGSYSIECLGPHLLA